MTARYETFDGWFGTDTPMRHGIHLDVRQAELPAIDAWATDQFGPCWRFGDPTGIWARFLRGYYFIQIEHALAFRMRWG